MRCIHQSWHPDKSNPIFLPIQLYSRGEVFYTQLHAHLHSIHLHIYTLFRASAKRPNVVTLSIIFRKIVWIAAAEDLLPGSTFMPNTGWQFHKTKRESPGNRGTAAVSMQGSHASYSWKVAPFRSGPKFQAAGKQWARQRAEQYLSEDPHPSGARAKCELNAIQAVERLRDYTGVRGKNWEKGIKSGWERKSPGWAPLKAKEVSILFYRLTVRFHSFILAKHMNK